MHSRHSGRIKPALQLCERSKTDQRYCGMQDVVSHQDSPPNYKPFDGNHDADAAFAQRLQNSLDKKDAVVYSKRKLQMREDAEYARSLAEGPINKTVSRTSRQQQQMRTVNDTIQGGGKKRTHFGLSVGAA